MKPSVKIYNRTKSARIRKKHYKLIQKEVIKAAETISIAINKFVEMIGDLLSKVRSGEVYKCYDCGAVEIVKIESLGKKCSKCNGRLIPIRF